MRGLIPEYGWLDMAATESKTVDAPSSSDAALAPSPGAVLGRRMFGHAGFLIGAIIIATIIVLALLAPYISPHDPYDQVLSRQLIPPVWIDSAKATWNHPLGTDQLGRDYLSRLLWGARISLLIGFAAMFISGVIGTTLGVAAGYFGGRVDTVINFIITTRLSMPVVLVALAVVSLIGSSLTVVIWVLGLLIWDRFAVVMRSATQQVRSLDFVVAAQAIGCSTWRIIASEIMPNILNHLIVIATLEMAHAILLEAALSFLGLGVQPPEPSWGLMISEAKGLMFFDGWLIAIPGTALFLLVLAINLLGDGMRDVMAPENRN
jgi:peptide/nickel transport system permease protein